jgi:hypothetical protein
LCYQYYAKNNGGETATADGQFTIDGVPPDVALIFPENGVFMNNNSLFQYSASDNLAPTVSCILYADSIEQGQNVLNSGETANASVLDLADGEHNWNVSCSDLAGNIGFSETRNFTTQYCGDGIANNAEDCDGADLDGASCTSLGYSSGTLSCSASCAYEGCSNGGGDGGGGGSVTPPEKNETKNETKKVP